MSSPKFTVADIIAEAFCLSKSTHTGVTGGENTKISLRSLFEHLRFKRIPAVHRPLGSASLDHVPVKKKNPRNSIEIS